jgi:hypothetical protein
MNVQHRVGYLCWMLHIRFKLFDLNLCSYFDGGYLRLVSSYHPDSNSFMGRSSRFTLFVALDRALCQCGFSH